MAPKTIKAYGDTVCLHIAPELGRIELGKLTPHAVTTMLRKKEREGLSPRSVAMIREVLRGALNTALKMQMIERNAAALADPPRQPKSHVHPLSAEQSRGFLVFSRDDRLGPLFAAALSTEMRQGELFGLGWEDIDLERNTVRVRRALQWVNGKPMFVEPKSESSRRTITLPAVAMAAFRMQRTRQLEQRLLAGDQWQDWGLVFSSSKGTPLDGPNVNKRLQALLAQAGLPRQRFHDLRHGCASLLLAAGVPPRTIMGVLGHSQISLTLNTYSHLSPALERDAADALDRMLAG